MADDGSVASVARARIANCNWQMFKLSRFFFPFSFPNHLSALQHIPSSDEFLPGFLWGWKGAALRRDWSVKFWLCLKIWAPQSDFYTLKISEMRQIRQLLWDDIHWYPSNYRTCAKYRNYASLKHWPDHAEWKASNCQGVSLWIVLESVWSGRGGLGRGQSCEGAEMERSSLAECRNCPCLYCNLVTSKASSRA